MTWSKGFRRRKTSDWQRWKSRNLYEYFKLFKPLLNKAKRLEPLNRHQVAAVRSPEQKTNKIYRQLFKIRPVLLLYADTERNQATIYKVVGPAQWPYVD